MLIKGIFADNFFDFLLLSIIALLVQLTILQIKHLKMSTLPHTNQRLNLVQY